MQALQPLESFILDVYIDIAPRHKAWVQDISPYIPYVDKLANALLDWEELTALEQQAAQSKAEGKDFVAEFRTAD